MQKEPIKLPKETRDNVTAVAVASVTTSSVQPDVIPQSKTIPEIVPEQSQSRPSHSQAPLEIADTENQSNGATQEDRQSEEAEQLYANVSTELKTKTDYAHNDEKYPTNETNDPIYQNQEDLLELIEDTGVRAIALYDYQAAADDEISFDPDDIITHIEQIDEGWWRGLCRNHYGLFPANYVQLQQ